MAGETEAFLAELEAREHDPLLAQTKGTLLIELLDGDRGNRVDRVLLQFRDGGVVADRSPDATGLDQKPHCVVRVRRALFDGFAAGRVNAMAAFLRGEVDIEGDPALLMRVGRLFPGPPDATASASAPERSSARSQA